MHGVRMQHSTSTIKHNHASDLALPACMLEKHAHADQNWFRIRNCSNYTVSDLSTKSSAVHSTAQRRYMGGFQSICSNMMLLIMAVLLAGTIPCCHATLEADSSLTCSETTIEGVSSRSSRRLESSQPVRSAVQGHSSFRSEFNHNSRFTNSRSMLQSVAAVNPGIVGAETPTSPALVDTPEEFMAAAQRGEEEILVMNHMDFTQLPYRETASLVLRQGTKVVRGDCHREAPADFCSPQTRPNTLPLLPRLTGQCILLVSGSLLRVEASDSRMLVQGLYIQIASPLNNTTSNTTSTLNGNIPVFNPNGTSFGNTTLSEQQANCTRALVDTNSTGMDLACVPKLLEVGSGRVWGSDLTLRGNGGSVCGISVQAGSSLYMKGGQLSKLGNATSVALLQDTAAFNECSFVNNTLMANSSVIFAQGQGAVKIQNTNFTSNDGGSTLAAATHNNVFYSDDSTATVDVRNFNSTGEGRRLCARPLDQPALQEGFPAHSFLSGDDEWFVAHRQVGVAQTTAAPGSGDRLSPLMIGLCVVGLVVMMVAIFVGATLFRRLTADRTETPGSPKFWATNMLGDRSVHSGMAGEDEDQGISISGKSLNPLMNAFAARSNFMAPLPEDFIEEEHSDSIHGMHFMHEPQARIPAREQVYPMPEGVSARDLREFEESQEDELADCYSEESSFCLPDPLQLQGKAMAQYHMHEMHQMEEEVAEYLDDDPDVHGDSSGYRGVTDPASIGVFVDSSLATQQDGGYVNSQQDRSDMNVQQWLGARRSYQPPGGRRGGQWGSRFGNAPALPNIPEESTAGTSFAGEDESGSVVY